MLGVMVRLSTTVRQEAAEVVVAAVAFFGSGGLGLELTERGESGARFVGGGGHVTVEARRADGRTEVTVTAREWEPDARRFIAGL
jgi:hypothetical protein